MKQLLLDWSKKGIDGFVCLLSIHKHKLNLEEGCYILIMFYIHILSVVRIIENLKRVQEGLGEYKKLREEGVLGGFVFVFDISLYIAFWCF